MEKKKNIETCMILRGTKRIVIHGLKWVCPAQVLWGETSPILAATEKKGPWFSKT